MRKHQVILGVLAAMAATASQASTYPEFKVNPTTFNQQSGTGFASSATPTFGSIFTANQIAGNYNEIISFDGLGNFAVTLRFNATSFNLVDTNSTTVPPTTTTGLGVNQTQDFGSGNTLTQTGYGLYALLTGTGTVSVPVGAPGPVLTLNPGGTISMYLDDNVDTGFNPAPANGTLLWPTTADIDDKLVATGVVTTGAGNTKPCTPTQIDCGSFGQNTTFMLTAVGSTFFVDPTPQFYSLSFQSGNLNANVDTTPGTRNFSGQLNVNFVNEVPEPGSLALAGLALAGLGMLSRRRKA